MRRYFQITTIYDRDKDSERREVTYETARTARDVLKRRGVHLYADEKARANHAYWTEGDVWIVYQRVSPVEVEN